jgi:hypothetical protein
MQQKDYNYDINNSNRDYGSPPATPAPISRPLMSVSDWFSTIILMTVPLVGFFVITFWAVSSATDHISLIKRNFARAYLIVLFLLSVLYIIIFVSSIRLIIASMS